MPLAVDGGGGRKYLRSVSIADPALTGPVGGCGPRSAQEPSAITIGSSSAPYGVDVSINLISVDHVQGTPLLDLPVDDFARGLDARLRTHFITARAAGRHMVRRGSGAILMLTAAPDRTAIPGAGSFGVQCAAVESFSRALAVELGPSGVRVACVRSAGSPETPGVDDVFTKHAANAGLPRGDYDRSKAAGTLLGRMPRLTEVAQTMVFLASSRATAITGAILNVTCGELLD